ncbi:unnamed protein product, partial [Symbiodinium microadriaticum]
FDSYLGNSPHELPCVDEAANICAGETNPEAVLTCLSTELFNEENIEGFSEQCKAVIDAFNRCREIIDAEEHGANVDGEGGEDGDGAHDPLRPIPCWASDAGDNADRGSVGGGGGGTGDNGGAAGDGGSETSSSDSKSGSIANGGNWTVK